MSSNLALIVADFTTSLSSALSIGATSGTLSSIVDDDGVNLPNGRYFFSLDVGNSSKEHISCDIVGTAISNIKSISRQGVVTTGVVRAHRLGATVTITNFAHIFYLNNLLNGTDNLDANEPLEYDASATITSNNQLTTLEKVLSLVNGGTVSIDQTVIAAKAGETLVTGEAVYQSESDGEWYKTDADDVAKSVNLNLGIAQGAGTDGNAITGGVLVAGLDKTQTYTAGAIYYLSDTAGDLSTSAGTNSVIVGVGDANNKLVWVNIYDRDAVTPGEKAALVGTTGTPSATNKYVTDDNVYSGEFDQEQTTQDAEIAVGEADSTGQNNLIAQSFTAGRTKIRGAVLWKEPNTGTNAGDITFSLQADSSGDPSGTDLATVTLTDTVFNALDDDALFEVTFGTEYAGQVQGDLYWIVVSSSTSDNSNHINLGTNSAGGYANGSVKRKNATDGWEDVSTVDLYFKTINGLVGQIGQNNIVSREFEATGTWSKPNNLSYITVEMVGGGGSGRSGTVGNPTNGGGGGGGAYTFYRFSAERLNSTESVVIGAGGTGNSVTGGDTSFKTFVIALGGAGAAGTAGGAGGATTGQMLISLAGGAGVSSPGAGVGGAGGNSIFGNGGAGGNSSNGLTGTKGGGGGGAGGTGFTQGNGGNGHVLITEYYF